MCSPSGDDGPTAACDKFYRDAFAFARVRLLPGKRIVIGCPKFDDAKMYAQKLGDILRQNNIASITVAHMEVPCCSALKWVVSKALEYSGKKIPVKEHEITVRGEMR